MSGAYSRFLEPLKWALAALPPRARSLVFAFGGERLLPLYEDFSVQTSCGSADVLRRSLDWVWSPLPELPSACGLSQLDEIAAVTPHGDHYPTLAGLSAQDACIVVDSAVREAAGVGLGENAIWYCLEPLRAAICDELTGTLDVGSDAEAERTERLIASNSRMLEEMALYLRVVLLLRDETCDISEVKALATATRWTPSALRKGA